jgi:hypothetical protein
MTPLVNMNPYSSLFFFFPKLPQHGVLAEIGELKQINSVLTNLPVGSCSHLAYYYLTKFQLSIPSVL